MKKSMFLFIAVMCLLLSACSSTKKLSISTPEKVYVTYYSGVDGSDVHVWELTRDEIDDWVVWLNGLSVSPIDLKESKLLIDQSYSNGSSPRYTFDVGPADAAQRIVYLDFSAERAYLRIDGEWYSVKDPVEPFNRY